MIIDERILFLAALAIQGEKKQGKIQEFSSLRLEDRKTGFNKTSGLFLTSHWARNSLE